MNRCRNWFCARNNNNDYTAVSIANDFASTLVTSQNSNNVNNNNNNNNSNNNNSTSNVSNNSLQNRIVAAALENFGPSEISQQQSQSQIQQQQQQQQQQTSQQQQQQQYQQMQQQRHQNINQQHQQPLQANMPSTSAAAAAAQQIQQQQQLQQQHMVTFLDEMPSGSNGIVSTSNRIVTTAEMQKRASAENPDNLDAIDFADGPCCSNTMWIDDSIPPAKNCFRLVMLGSSRVGKSSIVARFLGNGYRDSYTPTIEEFHRKLYRIRNEVYQLDIVDTSGYHPFPAMRRLSFLTGDLFILVFSMDSRESFEEVVRLRENILETKWTALNPGSGMKKKSLPKIPMVLAGNKSDREIKTVHLDEVMGYIAGQDNCCVFIECSARQNYHIDDLFYALFMVANLPLEMAPNHHRRVVSVFGAPSPLPPHSSAGGIKKNALSIKRRFSDACGVVTPNARRPSIRTDLNLMHSKTKSLNESEGNGSRRRRCIIM